MMRREIILRGKRLDNGEWVYGSLVYWPGNNEIGYIAVFMEDEAGFVFGDNIEVNMNTVGQYTGIKAKNGQRIFEGDIVTFDEGRFIVEYSSSRMGFAFSGLNGRGMVPGFHMTHWEHLEVIGNIHDNHELIGGGE